MVSIENKKDCCGCTACYSVCPKNCITMEEDSEGFNYPKIDIENCINCNMCSKVCPVLKDKPKDDFTYAYIVRNKNNDVLMNSSSGGAFTAFSDTAIDENYVVFGGAFDDDFNVIHDCAESKADAQKFRGSKYVQSRLDDTFLQIKNLLDSGRKVLFSGCPCQVAGLVSFLQKPYDNLITVDFVCHAVPSPKVWKKYREYLTSKYKSNIKAVNFRSKEFGYHCSSMKIEMENGKTQKLGMNADLLLKSFFQNVCCRPSCYDCHFKTTDRYSDITVFDCWDISRHDKNKKDDNKGYSAVLVHNQKGQMLFDKIKDKVECCSADLDVLMATDGLYATRSIDYNPKREKYFELLNTDMPLNLVVKNVIPVKFSKKILAKIKGVLFRTGLLSLLQKVKK